MTRAICFPLSGWEGRQIPKQNIAGARVNRVVQKAERPSISHLNANTTSFELCRTTEWFPDVSVFRQLIESRLVSRSAGQRRLLADEGRGGCRKRDRLIDRRRIGEDPVCSKTRRGVEEGKNRNGS